MTVFHKLRSRTQASYAYMSWKSDRRFNGFHSARAEEKEKDKLLIIVDFPERKYINSRSDRGGRTRAKTHRSRSAQGGEPLSLFDT